jgi:hypothetical protein
MKKGETFAIDPYPYILSYCENLSEKDRRLFYGLEAIRGGVHGVKHVSEMYKVNTHTVRKGKKELLSGDSLPVGQVRKSGGGRKKNSITTLFDCSVIVCFTIFYSRRSHAEQHIVDKFEFFEY